MHTQDPHPEEAATAAVSKSEDRGAIRRLFPTIFVYMLRCTDASYDVGSTRKLLEERLAEHNTGTLGGYTTSRRPVVLVWSQDFENADDAVAVERQIKGWSRAKRKR